MKKKMKTKAVNSKKPKSELLLELDGKVFVVEKKNGKETSKEEVDGTVVLKCLMSCLEEGITLMEKKLEMK